MPGTACATAIIDVITISRIDSISITTTAFATHAPPPTIFAIAAATPVPSPIDGSSIACVPSAPWNAIGTSVITTRHSAPDQKIALAVSRRGSRNSRA